MKGKKEWTDWIEFVKNTQGLTESERTRFVSEKAFKHCPIIMTHYYTPSWSGWHKLLSKTDQ